VPPARAQELFRQDRVQHHLEGAEVFECSFDFVSPGTEIAIDFSLTAPSH
jgi:hypothetical protein